MKRNTSEELLCPVNLNAREWYYVEKWYVIVLHQIPGESRPIQIKIPRRKLTRLLQIKEEPCPKK